MCLWVSLNSVLFLLYHDTDIIVYSERLFQSFSIIRENHVLSSFTEYFVDIFLKNIYLTVYFEITLDLQESCKISIKAFFISVIQLLNANILRNHSIIMKARKLMLVQCH